MLFNGRIDLTQVFASNCILFVHLWESNSRQSSMSSIVVPTYGKVYFLIFCNSRTIDIKASLREQSVLDIFINDDYCYYYRAGNGHDQTFLACRHIINSYYSVLWFLHPFEDIINVAEYFTHEALKYQWLR